MIETDDDLIELLMIPSVGRVKARAIYSAGFHTLQDISKASADELQKVPGISIFMAKSIVDFVGVMLGSQDSGSSKDGEPVSSLFVCPMCGSMVGSSTNECPGCGVTFSDEEDDEPSGPVEEEVKADEVPKLFICPECGSLISEGADKCLNCGVVFEDEDDVEEMPLEMELKDKSDDGTWHRDKAELYMCPGCGAFIPGDAEGCESCGAVFDAEDDGPKPQPREFGCPMCKSTLVPGSELCENCGFDFTADKDHDGFWYKDRGGIFMCPSCGSFINEGADTCQNCGVVFESDEEAEVRDRAEAVCPMCRSTLVPGAETCGDCGFDLSGDKVIDHAEKAELFMCPNCGAFIASDAKECGICEAVFSDEEEVDEPAGEAPEVTPEEPMPEGGKAVGPGDDLSLCTCPKCGSLLPVDSTRCDNCGTEITGVEDAPEQAPASDDDKDGFWYKDDDSLFMCPNCGAFIKSSANSCGTCGVVFEGEEETEKTIQTCPNCNKAVASGTEDCPSCGFHFEVEKEDADGYWYKDDASLFVCPNCGSFISETADTCNQCGIVFEGEDEALEPVEFERKEPDDIDQSLYLCSECGAFMSASASRCTVCGADIDDGTPIEDTKEEFQIPGATEELSAEIVAEIEEIEAETLEPPRKDIEELIKPEAKRGISKDFLSRWQKKEEAPVSAVRDLEKHKDPAQLDEKALEKELELDLLEIPEKTEAERLDEIDTALYSDPNDAELWLEKANILVELGQQDDAIACLDKAAELDPDKETDYKRRILALLGVGIEEEMTDLSEFLDLEMEEVTFDEALLIDKTEAEIDAIEEKLAATPKDEALWQEKGDLLEKLGRHEEAIKCFDESIRLSYADLQKESEGLVFSLKKQQILIGLTNGEGRIDGRINGLLSQQGMINGKGRTNGLVNGQGRTNGLINGLVNGRGRTNGLINGRGKTNGLINGLVNGRGRTNGLVNGQGRTNGLINGLVNGRGRTNGLVNGMGRTNGLVNGQARTNGLVNGGLINGLGLINGRGRIHASGHIERARKDWRYKVSWIVVLVALVLVIPMFSNLQSQTAAHSIAIDGNFSDWEEVLPFLDSATDQVFNPDLNILETKLVHDEDGLDLFISVEGTALGGGSPPGYLNGSVDSFFSFVDLDADPLTGYALNDLGADMMLEVYGWDNSAVSAVSYRFNEDGDHNDWNGFVRSASAPCALEGQNMEMRMVFPRDLLTDQTTPRVRTVAVSSLGFSDVGDSIMTPEEASVEVVARGTGPDVLAPGRSGVMLLRMSARSFGVNTQASWMNFTVTGDAFAADLGNARLVLDSDDDGTFDTASDTVLSTTILNVDTKHLAFALDEPQTITTDRDLNLFFVADLVTGLQGRTVGLSMTEMALGSGIAIVSNVDKLIHNIGAPVDIRIDGAFGDWQSQTQYVDAANDVVPDKANSTTINKNVDLADMRFGLDDELYVYASVSGIMMGGSDIPTIRTRPGPAPDAADRDTDRDTVPDAYDGPNGDGSMSHDFDNDGTPDVNEAGDVDNDGVVDYNHDGVDYWLNTTIPSNFLQNYSDMNVTVYVGPIDTPHLQNLGEDRAYVLVDSDDDPMSGAVTRGAIGADHAIVITGKHNRVTGSELYRYDRTASPPWVLVDDVPTAIDWYRMELVVDPLLMGITPTDNFTVFISMKDWKGDYDIGDVSVRSENMDTSALTRGTKAQKPKMAITKTVDKATAGPGDTLTYTISYVNTRSTAYDVVIREAYPTGVTFVSALPAPTSGDGVWDIGTLGTDEGGTIQVTVTVDAGVMDGDDLENTVYVEYTDGGSWSQRRWDSATTTVVIVPEMQHVIVTFIGLMVTSIIVINKRKDVEK